MNDCYVKSSLFSRSWVGFDSMLTFCQTCGRAKNKTTTSTPSISDMVTTSVESLGSIQTPIRLMMGGQLEFLHKSQKLRKPWLSVTMNNCQTLASEIVFQSRRPLLALPLPDPTYPRSKHRWHSRKVCGLQISSVAVIGFHMHIVETNVSDTSSR